MFGLFHAGGQLTVYMTAFGMRSDSKSPSGRRVHRGLGLQTFWTAVLFAVLLAFSWQSFVTQTHAHFATGAQIVTDSGQASSTARTDTGKRSSDAPADCPICQEIGHDGFYLLPTLAVLEAPQPAPLWQAVTISFVRAALKPSHIWRSRAPPVPLQA